MACGYLRRVTSTVAVDTSWNNQYSYINCFHESVDFWVLNWLESIKKTDFSPAKNIDVMGKYFIINYVDIQFLWSIRLKKRTRMKLIARRVPREWFDFWVLFYVFWHWVHSKSGLSVLLISDATVSDAV